MRAIDVRRLKPCAICHGWGLAEHVIHYGVKTFAHPPCLVRAKGEPYALRLPPSELGKMTLDSLSSQGMRWALDRLSATTGYRPIPPLKLPYGEFCVAELRGGGPFRDGWLCGESKPCAEHRVG